MTQYYLREAKPKTPVSVEISIVSGEVALTVFSGGVLVSLNMEGAEAREIAQALIEAANDLVDPQRSW